MNVSRSEVALLILVALTIGFLYWSRNVVVRTPDVVAPLWERTVR